MADTFIVAVDQKAATENFTSDDLLQEAEIIHEDCRNGSVWFLAQDLGRPKYSVMKCQRCEALAQIGSIVGQLKREVSIVAIDGGEKKLTPNVSITLFVKRK
jgi:hypothetical protein